MFSLCLKDFQTFVDVDFFRLNTKQLIYSILILCAFFQAASGHPDLSYLFLY